MRGGARAGAGRKEISIEDKCKKVQFSLYKETLETIFFYAKKENCKKSVILRKMVAFYDEKNKQNKDEVMKNEGRVVAISHPHRTNRKIATFVSVEDFFNTMISDEKIFFQKYESIDQFIEFNQLNEQGFDSEEDIENAINFYKKEMSSFGVDWDCTGVFYTLQIGDNGAVEYISDKEFSKFHIACKIFSDDLNSTTIKIQEAGESDEEFAKRVFLSQGKHNAFCEETIEEVLI
ncbi:MAG: hypothetical protein ACRC4W_05315 [Treponemataceae bacterium]